MKCDVQGCNREATKTRLCLRLCMDHYLDAVEGKTLKLKPIIYEPTFLRLYPKETKP